MKYLIYLFSFFITTFAFSQPRIVLPFSTLDTVYRNMIDTTLNGMIIRQGKWYESYGHEDFEIGTKTTLGAYIKGIRQGTWLIYHDSLLFARLSYLNGYVEGECEFWIVYDDFYEIVERERTSADSLYDEQELFYQAIQVKPIRLRYILRLTFVKGKAHGDAALCLPNGEKVMKFICKDNQLDSIMWLNSEKIDFELPITQIPFPEIWNNSTLLCWREYH